MGQLYPCAQSFVKGRYPIMYGANPYPKNYI